MTKNYSGQVGTGGWRGIHYLRYTSPVADTSSFEYCHVYDMKALYYSTTLAHFFSFRNLAIRNCDFHHNKSLGNGGCIHFSNDPPFYMGPITNISCEISGCRFYDNISSNNGWDSTYTPRQKLPGSVVYMLGCSPALIHNNSFLNNVADRVLDVLGDSAVVTNDTFERNNQADTATGNVSLIDFTFSTGIFKKNIVFQNASYYDAIICSDYSSVDINANLICNNICSYTGMAGYCFVAYGGSAIRLFCEDYSDSVTYHNFVRNNIIANNFTGTYGSAIYDYGVNAKIVNNTIVNNNAGGGNTIYYDYLTGQSPKLIVKNNIIYGNSGNFSLNSQGYIEINHNWLDVPLGSLVPYLSHYYRLNIDTANVVGTSARLVSPTLSNSYSEDALNANFYLQTGSPCIHAGDTTHASPDSTDYAGKARLTSGRIDIGAYQYHGGVLVNSIGAEEAVYIYPNPARGTLFVQTPGAQGVVQIADMSGKVISEQPVGVATTAVDLRHIAPGVYIVSWIEGGVSRWGQKVVVE